MARHSFPAPRRLADTSGTCVDELWWLKRELRIRQGAFTRWVNQGKMTKKDADDELKIIQNIIEIVELRARFGKKAIPTSDPRHPFYIKPGRGIIPIKKKEQK